MTSPHALVEGVVVCGGRLPEDSAGCFEVRPNRSHYALRRKPDGNARPRSAQRTVEQTLARASKGVRRGRGAPVAAASPQITSSCRGEKTPRSICRRAVSVCAETRHPIGEVFAAIARSDASQGSSKPRADQNIVS